MKPNLDSIIQYKNKLTDLKSRENDFNATNEKLQKAKDIFDKIKTKRYEEFMEGYTIISGKLKEMYQVILLFYFKKYVAFYYRFFNI